MKKYFWIVCICLIISVGVIGVKIYYNFNPISHLTIYDKSNENKTEIRLLSNWNYADNKGCTYQKIISKFNESHKDIFVYNDYVWNEEYYERLKADFSSENEPDIFISWPGQTVSTFVSNDKIVDLNPLLTMDDQWFESIDKSLFKYIVTDGGSVWGLPVERVFVAMFVNTDVLAGVGLKPAQTYDELIGQIDVLRSKGIVPISVDMSKNGMLLYKSMAAALGGKYHTGYIAKDGELNESYIKAGEYFKELYRHKAFPDNLFTISEKNSNDLFLNKKAAYIVQYSSFAGELKAIDEYDMNTLTLTSLPVFKDGQASASHALYGVGIDTLFVSKKAFENPEKRDKIIEFLKYITSDETASVLKENLSALVAFAALPETDIESINTSFIYSRNEIIDFPEYYINADVWTDIERNLPNILNGNKNISDILQHYAY